MLAVQHRKLVAQHQDLDLLGLPRPKAKQDQLEATAQRQVDERPDHADTSAADDEQAKAHRNPSSGDSCWSRPRSTSGTPRPKQ
jgi:hypothetical protein